jgi:heptosyltransferase-1
MVRIGAMGDVLHALPAVAALRRLRPKWTIGWVVEPRWLPLLQAARMGSEPGRPVVDEIYLAATRDWKRRPVAPKTLGKIFSLRRELRGGRFDLCVDMQGSIRSAVIGRMAGTKEFAGPREPREGPARWLYGEKIPTDAAHVIEQGCELLGRAAGLRLEPEEVGFSVEEDIKRECEAMVERLLPGGERFVLVVPTAGWGAKQWPAERFGAVAEELGRRGVRTLVNASGTDDPVAQSVVRASGGYAAVASADLRHLIALTRRASVVIAGDTGPVHLAAAMRRPVVALFGPTDPARNGPYGTEARVLRHGSERRDHRRLAEPEAGLLQITVEEVAEAAFELLQGKGDE